MAQGRGSASRATTIVVVALVWLLVQCLEPVDGVVYTVGGSGGWSLSSGTWPKGKRFKAGDVLVFNYNSMIHNVVAVNRGGYSSCTTPTGATVYNTGKDSVKLSKGANFFICNFTGHCQSGMKIAIIAA